MHHLYPVRDAVNSSRNNFPYYDIPDDETDVWFRFDSEEFSIPTTNIDEYSEKDNSSPDKFEPRKDHKGNAARSVFYFFAMYNDVADENFFNIQKTTLRSWHELDPVDQAEYDRSNLIGTYQNNLANPFCLDNTLIDRIWFSEAPQTPDNIVINELHYNPSTTQGLDYDYEFLELYNLEDFTVNLKGYFFTDGLEHVFTEDTFIGANSYLLLAKNSQTYTNSIQWTNGSLSNDGEVIILRNCDFEIADQISYDDSTPWDSEPDGSGPSLELISPELDNSEASNWSASINTGGTPGYANSIYSTDPSIQITSPNGSENWNTNSTYPITWSSYYITGNVKIELYKETPEAYTELMASTENDGTWEWNVSTEIQESSDYKIVITSLDNPSINDFSDEFFSISINQTSEDFVIISEYVEGSSYRKALEIYNGTGSTIDLSEYSIKKQTNGAGDFGNELTLNGTLSNDDVFVVVYDHSGVNDLTAEPFVDLATSQQTMTFNGNDAVALYHLGVQIDLIGVVASSENWGQNVTFVRKNSITSPSTIYSTDDWDSYPEDTFDYLGFHEVLTTPEAPENVNITVENGIVTITWDAVPGATSYKVYSSDDPYGTFTEDLSGTFDGNSWIGVVTGENRFYYVMSCN